MAKKHLLPPEGEEFLDRLGMTEKDKKVYIAILDAGLVSAGEVQQLTGLDDILQVLESVRDLTDIGLVKKAQGMLPRYYATLPFLRETLSIEQDFKFSMEAMLQSLNQAKEKTIQNRETISSVKFPNLIDNLLDTYYKQLIQPVLNDLKELEEKVNNAIIRFARSIDEENEGIKNEIDHMTQPLMKYANLMREKIDLGLTDEQGELATYISKKKQSRVDMLKKTHSQLSNDLTSLQETSKGVIGKVTGLETYLDEFSDEMHKTRERLNNELGNLKDGIDQVSGIKSDLTAEILVARQQMRRLIQPNNAGKVEVSPADIDTIFDAFSSKINKIDLDADPLHDVISNVDSLVDQTTTDVDQLTAEIRSSKIAFNTEFSNKLKGLGDNMASTLNELNDMDETLLMEFDTQMTEKLDALHQALHEEGEDVRKSLQTHIADINMIQDDIFDKWKNKMTDLHRQPLVTITPFLEKWIDKIEPIIDGFKADADTTLDDILEPVHKLENETFATLTERISFVKAMVEGRTSDLQSILEQAKEFDYSKTSDTWVVYGLPSIYASLTDLLMRTKVNVTVVTPNLDLELFEIARNLKGTIRVTFVADIDPERDARLIKKIEEIGRIRLRDYKKRDLYACMRDSEEMIMGYLHEDQEAVGIRASTPSVVSLLQDRLNETVIRDSKQI